MWLIAGVPAAALAVVAWVWWDAGWGPYALIGAAVLGFCTVMIYANGSFARGFNR